MKKKLIYNFNSVLIICAAFCFDSCSNIDSVNLPEDWPDQMQLNANDYNYLATQINDHFATLPLNQQELLGSFIDAKNALARENASTRTKDGSTCNCLPGQTSCSAEAWWSTCCICCSAGVSAACSSSGPITTCRCNEKDKSIAPAKAIDDNNLVTIFPNHFKELFTFANQNSIDLKSIEALFSEIIKRNL